MVLNVISLHGILNTIMYSFSIERKSFFFETRANSLLQTTQELIKILIAFYLHTIFYPHLRTD